MRCPVSYTIELSRQAKQDLKAMRAFDRRPVEAALARLASNPYPKRSEELTGEYEGMGIRRLPVKKWRIIYEIDEIYKIVFIKHVKLKKGPETYDNIDTN